MIYTKHEILTAIEKDFSALTEFVAGQNENDFCNAPIGKWTNGQHLDHLIKTTRPVALALMMPLFSLRFMFGKPNRAERTYDGLVEKYKSKLAAGAKAPKLFIPSQVSFDSRSKKIDDFISQKNKLVNRLVSLPEKQLSLYLLPHPLLGKLTIREMLYFTIYHTQHHLAIAKKQLMQ